MVVNGISMQGDGTYGPNFYPDYKVQYSLDSNPAAGSLITVKQENAAAAMVSMFWISLIDQELIRF